VSFDYSESSVINITEDNCSLNEPVLFIKIVSSYICCLATKLREWRIGKFCVLTWQTTFLAAIPTQQIAGVEKKPLQEHKVGHYRGSFSVFSEDGQWINF
jgi:hypothetical protein